MQKSSSNEYITVGRKFIIDHPAVYEPGIFTIESIDYTVCGKFIKYNGVCTIHETMCSFIEEE
jgi:hypothetical protein